MIEKNIFLSKFISFHNVFPIITTECPLWIRVLKFSQSISDYAIYLTFIEFFDTWILLLVVIYTGFQNDGGKDILISLSIEFNWLI